MEATKKKHLKYEFFDVTADVGYRAYGQSLQKAFENAAIAMFEVITDTSTILPIIEKNIHLEAEDDCAILYDWLSELLFLHDAEYLVFSKFEVKLYSKIDAGEKKYIIDASAFGEEFDPSRHERRSEVKAVTYHMMNIKFEDSYIVQVILDI
ncbi:archease [Methanobacterium sp. SMA-27]|uniref:archease n=1 Tax=Methanobacterium sp. SMA-27 TaxID=1495336 RepID=UPI00064F1CBD|nr:archease [Methanobacterium sp. SMA-27]